MCSFFHLLYMALLPQRPTSSCQGGSVKSTRNWAISSNQRGQQYQRADFWSNARVILHFPVLHFPVLLFGPPNSSPAFSSPAFSGHAFSSPAIWSAKIQSCIFQSYIFSAPIETCVTFTLCRDDLVPRITVSPICLVIVGDTSVIFVNEPWRHLLP